MTGYGVTLSVLPFHIERMALEVGTSADEATVHVGAITGIFALMQFFFAPLWGQLSDRIGRRPVLIAGMLGFALTNFLFGLSTNLPMLYLSRFFGGSLSAAVLPVTAAFVADSTDISQRGRGMAWMGSAAGLGVMIGPALGGWLAELSLTRTSQWGWFSFSGFSVPFFAAGIFAILALSATITWFKEPKMLHTMSPEIPLREMFRGIIKKKSFRVLLYYSFLTQFSMSLFEGTFALHAYRVMGFGPSQMGLVLMICGLVMAVGQGGMVSWFIDRTEPKKLLLTGLVLMGTSLVMLMIPRTMLFVLMLTAVFGFGMAMLIPVLATVVSRHAPAQAGAALGFQNAVNSLGQALGPLVGGLLFTLSSHLPYLLVGIILLCSAMFLRKTMIINNHEQT
jgi:DHA1 family multidrug resistance protein-like MFS transporter